MPNFYAPFADKSDNSTLVRLVFEHPMLIGEPCPGTWQWSDGRAQCLKGPRQPEKLRPVDVWKQWSPAEQIDLLTYIYEVTPLAANMCPAQPLEERHRCKPRSQDDLLDPIVDVARNVKPLPQIPGRAVAYLNQGNAELKHAKTDDDVLDAIRDYSHAITQAPWWGNAYYNRGRAEEIYGLDMWAVADYKRFLMLNPSPEDAQNVRKRIAALQ
jgi:hypothetical protein